MFFNTQISYLSDMFSTEKRSKIKFIPVEVMKAHRGSKGISLLLLFLFLALDRDLVVNDNPQLP